jgi:hypothetical protein
MLKPSCLLMDDQVMGKKQDQCEQEQLRFPRQELDSEEYGNQKMIKESMATATFFKTQENDGQPDGRLEIIQHVGC